MMTLKTRGLHVQKRASDMMVRYLGGPFALIRHVTVRAGDAASGMDTLIPHLKFRVLGLQNGSARFLMNPVLVADFVVISLDVIRFQPILPRIGQHLFFAFEIVLHMALGADKSAHLLSAAVPVFAAS